MKISSLLVIQKSLYRKTRKYKLVTVFPDFLLYLWYSIITNNPNFPFKKAKRVDNKLKPRNKAA